MKNKIKHLVRVVVFALLFVLIFNYVSGVMSSTKDYRNYQWVAGFYEEPANSLDGVYIGSSNCYTFWNPMTAWEEHGIAVWPYACNGMMFEAVEYLIKDCRKTQPDALYIININGITSTNPMPARIHWLADYMPFSLNKLEMLDKLCDVSEYTGAERTEFFLPMYLYHNRWSELTPKDFNYELNGLKGSSTYDAFLYKAKNVSKKYLTSNKVGTLTDRSVNTINSLINYCDSEDAKVLFVTVPRGEKSKEHVKTLNAANEYISSKGYPTLNLNNAYDEIGLDLTQDYYSKPHTNIHGSIKFSNYISEYLIENYDLKDKRDDENYISWNEGWSEYSEIISCAVLDFELTNPNIDTSMKMPENIKVKQNDNEVNVKWEPVDGATNYAIYRKTGSEGSWSFVSNVQETTYTDTTCEKENMYKYRVVPFYQKDNETYYGFFNLDGVEITIK